MSTFFVNGTSVTVEQNQKLMRYLRDTHRLTSVKYGCSEGACGTCTALIDGAVVRACTRKVETLDGAHILTPEGLSAREQEVYAYAFAEAGAVQCGYCTPGMLLSGIAMLNLYPHPTREQIRKELEGNICRCTGYERIADAVMLAAERMSSAENA